MSEATVAGDGAAGAGGAGVRDPGAATALLRVPAPRFTLPWYGRLGLLLTLFAFYLLSSSRERPWGDATPVFQVAEAIVERGELDVPTAWPPTLPRGPDGKTYAVAPLLQSLVHVPGAWWLSAARASWPEGAALLWPWAAHFAPAALGALCCLLFLGLCRQEGFSLATALGLTAALGLATAVWVYARYPYSEILQAVCLTGCFAAVLRCLRVPTIAACVRLALWAGILVSAKPVYATSAAALGPYLLWVLVHRHRLPVRALLLRAVAILLALLPFAAGLLLYNRARFGSFFSTGYRIGEIDVFNANPIMGLWGMFLSPGKSLLLYSPPLVLALVGLRRARRDRGLVAVLLLLAVPPLLLYARFLFWSGDWAWGPRYATPFVPMFLLPAAHVLEALRAPFEGAWARTRRALAATAVTVVLLCGVGVQIVGSGLYWDHYVRLSTEAGSRWLGRANVVGSPAYLPGNCGACFEEMYFQQWLPPFQPILGQYWLLRHVFAKHGWAEAAVDAPWLAYTNAAIHAEATYNRARLDWWYRDWHDQHRAAAETIILNLLLGIALGLLLTWLGALRARRAQAA